MNAKNGNTYSVRDDTLEQELLKRRRDFDDKCNERDEELTEREYACAELENLLRNEKVDRHFMSYKPLREDRSNLKKVLCYIYLVLCCDVPKGKARSILQFKGDTGRKRLETIMKEHELKAYEILHWSGLHTWKEPENITGKKKQVLDLAIIEIDQEKIRAKAPVKRERLREILKELGLNTKEQRLFARVANQKNRSNEKTEQPDDHVQQA